MSVCKLLWTREDPTEDKWLILHRRVCVCVEGYGMWLRVAFLSVMSTPAVCQVYEAIFISVHAHREHFGQLEVFLNQFRFCGK